MNTTPPGDVHLVEVHGREDGIYAFTAAREAQRFANAVNAAGGDADVIFVPLNLSPDHTDDLIAAEGQS